MKDKVSIIVPVYKVEEYLPKCIDSILAQDYTNWELILVNDGSPDNSGEICDIYSTKDSRIFVIHTQNKGVSHARNLGLAKATGEIVCFIDSDDWVERNYLSSMMKYSDDDGTFVYGNIIHDRSKSNISTVGFPYVDGDCSLCSQASEFMVRNRIPENGYPFAKFFRKRIIEQYQLKFDERISLHEDHLFVLQYLLKVNKIVLAANPCYHYIHRDTGDSLSAKKHPAKNLIIASDALIKIMGLVICKFQIQDKSYVKKLYTKFGLSQLIRTVRGISKSDLDMVGIAIRKRFRFFLKYYDPVHCYARFVPFLFFLRIEKIFVLPNSYKIKNDIKKR